MDVRFDAAAETFRHEVRTWLEANVPTTPMPRDPESAFNYMRDWQRKTFEAGWAGIHWPQEYGGRGATLVEQAIFAQEIARVRAPQMANGFGLSIVGPTLMPRRRVGRRSSTCSSATWVKRSEPRSSKGDGRRLPPRRQRASATIPYSVALVPAPVGAP